MSGAGVFVVDCEVQVDGDTAVAATRLTSRHSVPMEPGFAPVSPPDNGLGLSALRTVSAALHAAQHPPVGFLPLGWGHP